MAKKTKKNIVAVIPARMASTRFPGKPLARLLGLPMLEHIRRRLVMCEGLSKVVVATCDNEIRETIESYGGEVIMTSDRHERCTDRVAEAAQQLDADIIVNVQGDEPMIKPRMISQLVEPMLKNDRSKCANLVSVIMSDEEFENPNAVKAVLDLEGDVLYFSREPIPSRKKTREPFKRYKQLGVIAFTKPMLLSYSKMKETPLEKIESIDMMRLLENGFPVKAVIVEEPLYGVDTPDDLKRVEFIMKDDEFVREYM